MNELKSWGTKLKGFLQTLTPVQRASVGVVAAAGVFAAAWLIFGPDRLAYRPLYPGLSAADAREIEELLSKQGTPFRSDARTGGIEVPVENIEQVRMSLAAEGLPRQGGPGFEIFDASRFGMTEFDQKIALQRALQGELERTIRAIDAVEAARVHLVMPQRALFRREQEPASASVVLRLRRGRTLDPAQLFGIAHLVSSAVSGLDPEQVTVIDQRGTLLTKGRGAEEKGALSQAGILDRQKSTERELEQRIEELVSPVTGPGRVVARVGVELNLTHKETNEVRYDPDAKAVRSETRSEESDSGAQGVGPAGTQSVPTAATSGAATSPSSSSSRTGQQETINYEVTKSESRSVQPAGGIERVTAAVLVDGTYGDQDQKAPAQYEPRSAEEMAKITALVRDAIGFSESRGDRVHVENVRFRLQEAVEPANDLRATVLETGLKVLRILAWPAVFAIIYFGIVRHLIRFLVTPRRPLAVVADRVPIHAELSSVEPPKPRLPEIASIAAPQALPETTRLRGEIEAVARTDPQRVALAIQSLLHE